MFERNRIAETLRSARERQGLSLEQAAAGAGIPLQYLRLLEGESNVKVGVSDELYLIPFFRKYAQFLGIDAEEMLPEFLGVVQQVPGEGSPPIRLTFRPRGASLWKPAAVVLAIGVAVLLMLRQGSVQRPLDERSPSTKPAGALPASIVPPPTSVGSPTTPDAVVTATLVRGESTPEPQPATAPEARGAGAHELRIVANEEAWLSVAVDEEPAKEYMLRAGESRSWSAAQGFTLTVGNAGGITLSLDGRELPPLGRMGQVVRNLKLPQVPLPSPTRPG